MRSAAMYDELQPGQAVAASCGERTRWPQYSAVAAVRIAAHEEVEVDVEVILLDGRRVGVVERRAGDRAMLRVARHVATATHRGVRRRGERKDAREPQAVHLACVRRRR